MIHYSEKTLQYFRQLTHVGEFAKNTPQVYTVRVGAAHSGAMLQLQIQLKQRQIIAARFKAYGDVALLALGAYLAQHIIHMPVEKLAEISKESLLQALALPRVKQLAAVLWAQALREMVNQCQSKSDE
jgi:NifU-like protein involved in Fe-S cluster formation